MVACGSDTPTADSIQSVTTVSEPTTADSTTTTNTPVTTSTQPVTTTPITTTSVEPTSVETVAAETTAPPTSAQEADTIEPLTLDIAVNRWTAPDGPFRFSYGGPPGTSLIANPDDVCRVDVGERVIVPNGTGECTVTARSPDGETRTRSIELVKGNQSVAWNLNPAITFTKQEIPVTFETDSGHAAVVGDVTYPCQFNAGFIAITNYGGVPDFLGVCDFAVSVAGDDLWNPVTSVLSVQIDQAFIAASFGATAGSGGLITATVRFLQDDATLQGGDIIDIEFECPGQEVSRISENMEAGQTDVVATHVASQPGDCIVKASYTVNGVNEFLGFPGVGFDGRDFSPITVKVELG